MLFTILAPGLGAFVLLTTSNMWLEPFMYLGTPKIVIFLLISSTLTASSLVPTHATSLIAGILFGPLFGPILALSSVVISAHIGYTIMGRMIGERLINSLLENSKAQQIHHHLLKKNNNKTSIFIILLRLSPIMPFAATNLILASCKTSLKPYLIGSTIGLAPRVIIVALAGVGLEHLDLSQTGDQRIAIVGFIATILVLVYITKIVKTSLKVSIGN
jgi:uncharacterized membrane protein YdjX (TVP38/TMEM64 family)